MKTDNIRRRQFLQTASVGAASIILNKKLSCAGPAKKRSSRKPNLVFIFGDQWRAQATGYAGNADVKTPNLDKLAAESVNFSNAVSGCPVCSPYRASLMTGRYPLTHGVFLNDVRLNTDAVSIAQAYIEAGYETSYIGKWHLNGRDRSAFIPKERRQGFKFWKAMDCTHNYNNSFYYGDENIKLKWQGYDATAQTHEAQRYIREHVDGKPFALFLSWGPPHSPYHTAPQKYKDLFKSDKLKLRPNVPKNLEHQARKTLAGYYAHIVALDDCIGELLRTLKELGLENDTIVVFTSDHGDMLFSQGKQKKQKPWDESILVPFLIRYPALLGKEGRTIDMPINAPDIMPTLLGLSSIKIPDTVEGTDFSNVVRAKDEPKDNVALISCPSPFGQWRRANGGREYRGLRTRRYTYVRDLKGPWLLYDNEQDPYQLNNLCNKSEYKKLQKKLESILSEKLKETNDEFLSGWDYIKKWGHVVDESGTVPYTNYSWQQTDKSLSLLNHGHIVWQLNHDKQGKPYFHPLSTIDGVSLTWLSPPDHPWHYALWFSWKFINGVNYWEEDRKTGLPAGLTEVTGFKVKLQEDFSAQIEMDLSYHPAGEAALLTEKRHLNVSAPDKAGNYRIDWHSDFTSVDQDVLLERTPIEGQNGGRRWGGYGGLAYRANTQTMKDVRFIDSQGLQDLDIHTKPTRWVDLSGQIESDRCEATGVTIFDHPSNTRHPPPGYVIKNEVPKHKLLFAYMNPGLLYKSGIKLSAGQSLKLCYRIFIHEDWGQLDKLEAEFEKFAATK